MSELTDIGERFRKAMSEQLLESLNSNTKSWHRAMRESGLSSPMLEKIEADVEWTLTEGVCPVCLFVTEQMRDQLIKEMAVYINEPKANYSDISHVVMFGVELELYVTTVPIATPLIMPISPIGQQYLDRFVRYHTARSDTQ